MAEAQEGLDNTMALIKCKRCKT